MIKIQSMYFNANIPAIFSIFVTWRTPECSQVCNTNNTLRPDTNHTQDKEYTGDTDPCIEQLIILCHDKINTNTAHHAQI